MMDERNINNENKKRNLRTLLYVALFFALSLGLYACYPKAANHDLVLGGVGHSTLLTQSGGVNNCKSCHGENLRSKKFLTVTGQSQGTGSCYQCHDSLWSKEGHTKEFKGLLATGVAGSAFHKSSLTPLSTSVTDTCGSCHGSDLNGVDLGNGFKRPSCYSCHSSTKWTALVGTHTFSRGGSLHGEGLSTPTQAASSTAQSCASCHGADLKGTTNRPSCTSCHSDLWNSPLSTHTEVRGGNKHGVGLFTPDTNCAACHGGSALTGNTLNNAPSCTTCHADLWNSGGGFSSSHTEVRGGKKHKPGLFTPTINCTACHGTNLEGNGSAKSCTTCHTDLWNTGGGFSSTHTQKEGGYMHKPGLKNPKANCTACHGASLTGGTTAPSSCYKCHGDKWSGGGDD